MEDGLADEPQEAVDAGPELAQLDERLGTVAEEIDGVDAVAEAEDEAAGDDGGDDRGEDLGDDGHGALERVLVLLGRRLGRVLAHALDAGDPRELLVVGLDVVADDDLELAALREGALRGRKGLDSLDVGLRVIVEDKSHAGDAVAHRRDVLLAAHEPEQLGRVLRVLAHVCLPFLVHIVLRRFPKFFEALI